MILRKVELIFIVTIFAIVFTSLVYIFPPKYAQLWLSLEIIIIPTLYLIGYELMLDRQKKENEHNLSLISERTKKLEEENYKLRIKFCCLKKKSF